MKISVKLTPKMWKKIAARAKREGRTLSRMGEMAFKLLLSRKR